MSTENNVPKEVAESIRNELGEKGKHVLFKLVKVETKQDKWENRILVLSVCRAFVFTMPAKPPPKVEHEFHFLDIQSFESTKPLKLSISVSDKIQVFLMTNKGDADDVILHVGTSLKRYFPNIPFEKFVKTMTLDPTSRHDKIKESLEKVPVGDPGPCGGYSNMYACMCDYYQLPYREEIAWDIDTIYLSQNTREMCLNDFDHLHGKDLIPVISALSYNQWFNKISAKDLKLLPEAAKQIVRVLQRNPNILELELENTGINKWEFGQDLSWAIQAPSNLRALNLKGNQIDDRGIQHLSAIITKLADGMTELNLSNTKITAKGASNLGNKLAAGKSKKTLHTLKLSDNSFKGEDFAPMLDFLSHPNGVTHLDLSNCELALETVFPALLKGCPHTLTHLNLARNAFTYRKIKDLFIPQAMKEYFSTATALKHVNLSGNKLPPEVIKDILLGIASNGAMKDLDLDISNNEMRGEGARVLESCIANIPAIGSLDVSDNGFEGDLASVLDWICKNHQIKSLNVGGNIHSVRQNAKQMNRILDTIVKLLQDENGSLESLSLADSKLKADTATVLDAVGSNTILTYLDISGNSMGDVGARILAKALQINTKLKTIKLDRNNLSVHGLQDIANALERNHTIESMPAPVSDAGGAFKANPEKTYAAISKIEGLLKRNHSNVEFAAQVNEQAFRLQQSFHVSTSQQIVNGLTSDVEKAIEQLSDCEDEKVKADIEEAKKYVEDARHSSELLNKMYAAARDTTQSIIDAKIQEIKENLTETVKEQLQKTVEEMLRCGENLCPSVVKDELKTDITMTAEQKSQLSDNYIADWVEKQAGVAISNKASELHLSAATAVSNKITDKLLDSLADSRRKLNVAVSEIHRKKTEKSKLSFVETPDEEPKEDHKTSIERKRRSVRPKSVLIRANAPSNTSSQDSLDKLPEAYPAKPLRHHQYETVDTLLPIEQQMAALTENDDEIRSSRSLEDTSLSSGSEPATGESTPNSMGSGSLLSPSPAPSPAPGIIGDFDDLPSASPLKPVTEGRVRRPKRVRPTKHTVDIKTEDSPVNAVPDDNEDGGGGSDALNMDVSRGVESFFGAQVVIDPDSVRPNAAFIASEKKTRSSSPSPSEKESKKPKKEKKAKKEEKKDDEKKTKEEKKTKKFILKDKKEDKKDEKKDKEKKEKSILPGFFSKSKLSAMISGARDKSPGSKKVKQAAAEKEKQKSDEELNIYEEVEDQTKGQEAAKPQEVVPAQTRKAESEVRKSTKSVAGAVAPSRSRREEPKEASRTPDDSGSESREDEAEEEVPVAKKPMGVPMFGAAMGQGFLAEMKSKQRKSVEKIDVEESKVEEKKQPAAAPAAAEKVPLSVDVKSEKQPERGHADISPKARPRSTRISQKVRSPSTMSTKESSESVYEELQPVTPEKGSGSPVPKPRSVKARDKSPAQTLSVSASPKPAEPSKDKQDVPEKASPVLQQKRTSKTVERADVEAERRSLKPAGSEKADEAEADLLPKRVEQQPVALPGMVVKVSSEAESVEAADESAGKEEPQAVTVEEPVKVAEKPKDDETVNRMAAKAPEQQKSEPEPVKADEEPAKENELKAVIQSSTSEPDTTTTTTAKVEPAESQKQPSVEPEPAKTEEPQKKNEPETVAPPSSPKLPETRKPDTTQVKATPPVQPQHESVAAEAPGAAVTQSPPPSKKPQAATQQAPINKEAPSTPPLSKKPAAIQQASGKPATPSPPIGRKPTITPQAPSNVQTPSPPPGRKPTATSQPQIKAAERSSPPLAKKPTAPSQPTTQQTPSNVATPSPPSSRKNRPKPPPPIKPKPSLLKKPGSIKQDSPPTVAKTPAPTKPARPKNEGVVRETQQKMSVKDRAKQINTIERQAGDEEAEKPRSNSLSKMNTDTTDSAAEVPPRSKSVGQATKPKELGQQKEASIPEEKNGRETAKAEPEKVEQVAKQKPETETPDQGKGDRATGDTEKGVAKTSVKPTAEVKEGADKGTPKAGETAESSKVRGESSDSQGTEGRSEDELSPEIDLEGEGYVFV